jgi:hypothetical protein
MASEPSPAAGPLSPFLPAGTVDYVAELLAGRSMKHRLEVRVSRPRRTKLGDHRGPGRGRDWHRITVNEDLNPYAFLTTLLHEIAHATTWEKHRGRRVRPHGSQWKTEFGRLLEPVVATGCLPDDIAAALSRAMRNPAAATCSDRTLLLALAKYDRPQDGLVRVEELPTGGLFCLGAAGGARLGGRVFRRGRRIRTRYQCFESRTGREYRVHALSRVELVVVPAVAVTRTLSAADFAAGISGSASRPGRRRPSGARLRLP